MGILIAACITKVTPADMLEALTAAWRQQMGGYPTQAQVCTLLAQWALETGGGASMVCFNVGNFKQPDPSAGDFCYFTTTERIHGETVTLHPPDPGCRFAAFHSLTEGCEAYIHAMYTRWSNAWTAVVAGDPTAFAKLLHDAGYYTADPAVYAAGVVSWFARVSSLPWIPPPERSTDPEPIAFALDVNDTDPPPSPE